MKWLHKIYKHLMFDNTTLILAKSPKL